MNSTRTSTFPYRTLLTVSAISAGYLLLSAILIGYKPEQLFLVILFNFLFYLSGPTRRFILGFSVFIVFWIIFDSMKAFPNYRFQAVHIGSLYRAEQQLFGIRSGPAGLQTPNEYLAAHGTTFLDILSGFFYLCWMPLPLAFAGWLFYKDKTLFWRFSLTFLLVNLLGFIIYYAYPAAPPWYVRLYGFDFHSHTPGNTAGLGRFDSYFHVSVFSSLYAKSSNVFAAMPSLHAAYPLTVLYYGIRAQARWFNALFAAIMAGIWFAAVYTGHHYVLDVLAGIICGLAGIFLFNALYRRADWFARFVGACVSKTQ
ncbi:MAG: phosphatase PAP2 family protein [Bacteroidota bacterium]|nr:phosphatase PAP2 family protein [Bacteroidota bacterium]MDP4217608.1 phosphatase PAP2 family protein [Bacteroidota bacterium]MDP4246940.1 phosphatase PAP2 family protein [Bacteroidota bacterium]MDP4252800.1 phosphatase PAP2 family protein [Bacteroidota bacterium]MDP4257707.1 phosphatase PAP2 family protein [Bacteroidota bacterium]